MSSSAFFKPAGAWVGDLIPVERDGELWLYYLLELRESPKPGTPWALVRTRDLVSFEDCGVALPHGAADAYDFNAYTGSVVRAADGTYHLFYTGQNPRRLGPDGLPRQVVMHATSVDEMTTWTKHPEHGLGAPTGYETADWRDPYVFRDEESGVWRMLVPTSWLTAGISATWWPRMPTSRTTCVTTNVMKTGTSAVTDSFTPRMFITVSSTRPPTST